MTAQLGMWQPKQKDGKNWRVDYTVTTNDGAEHQQSRKFRVRDDAYQFISRAKELVADPRTNAIDITYKVSKT